MYKYVIPLAESDLYLSTFWTSIMIILLQCFQLLFDKKLLYLWLVVSMKKFKML